MNSACKGFSLVELSIVLVILGLLVGGVLTGQSLIRAAELRSVTTELQQYQTAIQTFRDRFFALPGDMRNATDFWGLAGGTDTPLDATCLAVSSTGSSTCNGDGDGQINFGAATQQETFRAWQHLANAGLVEGSFTGVAGPDGTVDHVFAENSPRSKLNNAGWAMRTQTSTAGGTTFYAINYGNEFLFGRESGSALPVLGVITPEEAWNVDTKIDDGQPGRGNVILQRINVCSTSADNADLDGEYLLSSTLADCALRFRNAF